MGVGGGFGVFYVGPEAFAGGVAGGGGFRWSRSR